MNFFVFCALIGVILGANSCLSEINVIKNETAILHNFIKEEVSKYVTGVLKRDNLTDLTDDIISADIDEFVDKVVVSVRNSIAANGYDTIPLPDESGIKLKPTGKLNLLEGSLSGLTSMQRFEQAILTYDRTTKKLAFQMTLRFAEIDFIYKYHSKVLFVSSTGHLHGQIKKLKIRINLGFDFDTYQAFVDDVDVKETGTINIWLSGNSGIDWFTNSVIKVVTSILHPVILNAVTNALKNPINTIVKDLNDAIYQALHPSYYL